MPKPSIAALVPMKAVAGAKSRLSSALDPLSREALCLALLQHALLAARAADLFTSVTVLGGDALVRSVAAESGALWSDDGARSLNPALAHAATRAFSSGADGVLIPHGDLGLVEPADLQAAVDGSIDLSQIVLAPAERDGGTNLLLLPRDRLLGPYFGPASYAAHLAAFKQAGFPVTELRRETLSLDLDTPQDLARYHALGRYLETDLQPWRRRLLQTVR